MEENKITLVAQMELLDEIAEAAVSLNPNIQWAKIIVTDDQPNLNKQRIPLDEFENIIRTGINTPIKMTDSEISRSHKDAMGKVIGTITQLVQEETRVVAIAAFWKFERPEDVSMLKKMYLDGNPPNVSWEITYRESQVDAENVEELHGVALNGIAIVAKPAYAGRTPFVAMSSVTEEDENVEELELAKQRITELETKVAELEVKAGEADTELTDLRAYKQNIETEKARAEKIQTIKTKFEEAGIQKDAEYFDANAEKLLAMSEDAFEFMLQELVAFKPAESAQAEDNGKNIRIPNFTKPENSRPTAKELGAALREFKA